MARVEQAGEGEERTEFMSGYDSVMTLKWTQVIEVGCRGGARARS